MYVDIAVFLLNLYLYVIYIGTYEIKQELNIWTRKTIKTFGWN